MRVAVLGAGVIGVTTAYYLAERGHSVTVIDRASAVAAETSYANGGQLSYSYTDSLASPAFVLKMPSLLLGLDPAIRVRIVRNLMMVPWGIRFLSQCTTAKATANTVAVLKIALRSAELIEPLRRKLALEFDCKTVGKLILLGTKNDCEAAKKKAALKRQHGCETQVLTRDEVLTKEPSLEHTRHDFAGAVYAEHDQMGDAHAFTQGLSRWLLENRSVRLRLDEEVKHLEVKNGRLHRLVTTKETLKTDAAVVCLGSWSPRLLGPHGIDPMIYPVRGYSVTLPLGRYPPIMSVTNLKHRFLHSRLNDSIRITGFADFVGFDTRRDEHRLSSLLDIAQQLAPEAANYAAAKKHPWGGFRPVTPSGRPCVGPTKIDGLFLNTGHGSLGWTLACATGDAVAAAIGNSR